MVKCWQCHVVQTSRQNISKAGHSSYLGMIKVFLTPVSLADLIKTEEKDKT